MSRPGVPGVAAEVGVVACAAAAVGWAGTLRGPVEFHGTRFYAVVREPARFGPPQSGWLVGSVVAGTDPYAAMTEASLLAAYSSRLIAVHGPAVGRLDAVDVQLQAALLDQGVVAHDRTANKCGIRTTNAAAALPPGGGCSVWAWPGEVVPSLLWLDDRWPTDHRWRAFYTAVTPAPLHGLTTEVSSWPR